MKQWKGWNMWEYEIMEENWELEGVISIRVLAVRHSNVGYCRPKILQFTTAFIEDFWDLQIFHFGEHPFKFFERWTNLSRRLKLICFLLVLAAVTRFFDKFFLRTDLENWVFSNTFCQFLLSCTENMSKNTLCLFWHRTSSQDKNLVKFSCWAESFHYAVIWKNFANQACFNPPMTFITFETLVLPPRSSSHSLFT